MLFNSFEFVIFLPIVFILYWLIPSKRINSQNFLLLIASYIFYGWWDWKFLSLIILSSFIDFYSAKSIEKYTNKNKKKIFLLISIFSNLGILGFFKYFNFFIDSFGDLISLFGFQVNYYSLNIILPVGISFYTFQTMSYTIDVYRGKMNANNSIISFFAYVSFFPQLVAGPIERAKNLLPQFNKKRNFSYPDSVEGLRLILWGLFKKVVIADNCAVIVNQVFNNYQSASSAELIMGTVFFAIQIYGDFSGYSDIAIGVARLFGFKLTKNFMTPYFSRDVAEFWRRWHISLSTWFRDYLYIPLGGSRSGKKKAIINTILIFTISGFWHGANWTFIFWGFLNALYFLPLLLTNKNRKYTDTIAQSNYLPSPKEIFQVLLTFTLICISWVFFRSNDINSAFYFLYKIVFNDHYFILKTLPDYYLLVSLLFFLLIEWLIRVDGINYIFQCLKFKALRFGLYLVIVTMIGLFGAFNKSEFIYFQF